MGRGEGLGTPSCTGPPRLKSGRLVPYRGAAPLLGVPLLPPPQPRAAPNPRCTQPALHPPRAAPTPAAHSPFCTRISPGFILRVRTPPAPPAAARRAPSPPKMLTLAPAPAPPASPPPAAAPAPAPLASPPAAAEDDAASAAAAASAASSAFFFLRPSILTQKKPGGEKPQEDGTGPRSKRGEGERMYK